VMRPFVGRALLNHSEKTFLAAGSAIAALSSFAYLVANPFFPLFFLRVFQGIGFALFSTSSFTLVANITPEANRGQGISYFYLAVNVAAASAPVVGILIINHLRFSTLFLFCAVLSLCSFLVISRLGKYPPTPVGASTSKSQPILSAEALPPSIMGFISNNIWGALIAFFPLFALSHGVANPGIFYTALAGTLIIGRACGGKILDSRSREKIVLPCIAVQIIAMIILAFSSTLPMFILAAVLWGMGNSLLFPLMMVMALDRGGTSRGPAMGTYTALVDLGSGMGSAIMGVVLQWTSFRTMFLWLALTAAINFFYYHFFVRRKGGPGHADL